MVPSPPTTVRMLLTNGAPLSEAALDERAYGPARVHWLTMSLPTETLRYDAALEVKLVQSDAARVEVMNAVVLEAHHFVQTHTDMQGDYEVTLVEDDNGHAQRRRVYLLPFVSDAFDMGGGFMDQMRPSPDSRRAPGGYAPSETVTDDQEAYAAARAGAMASKQRNQGSEIGRASCRERV